VLRGGYWNNYGFTCRTAQRYNSYPTDFFNYFGFRSVLPSGQ
jgi:hypothetical protein